MLGYSESRILKKVGGDCDGVKIGDQCWMAVNLDIDDGLGGIYAYNNDESNVATYGRLYTWDAAMRIADSIDGWHLPTNAEWTELINYLGGLYNAGGPLKEAGTTHWDSPNAGATNTTGFTALPGGRRRNIGFYQYLGDTGYWWSATENDASNVFGYQISYSYRSVTINFFDKEDGYSVRLIKDQP